MHLLAALVYRARRPAPASAAAAHRWLRREEGIALPVAMMTLLIVGLLAAMLLSTALQSSQSSRRDRDTKTAESIARAAMNAALYRLNVQTAAGAVPDADCFTTSAVPMSGGSCPGETESYGSNGQFTYWVTPVLSTANPSPNTPSDCTGYPVQDTTGDIAQRCVTAVATSHAVTRRLEERIVAYRSVITTWPVDGILGLSEIDLSGNGIGGNLGSNGYIKITGAQNINGHAYYGPSGGVSGQCSGTCIPTPVSAFATPQLNTALFQTYAQSNNDGAISWGAGVTYNAARREVSGSGANVTLSSGIYDFCDLNLTNSQISIAPGANVQIWIDSAASGTGCPAGDGNLALGSQIVTPSGDPTSLAIQVYGDPASHSLSVDLDSSQNTSPMAFTLYAPNSPVTLEKGFNGIGEIVAYSVNASTQSSFTSGGYTGGAGAAQTNRYYPAAYTSCPSSYSGNPRSGCY